MLKKILLLSCALLLVTGCNVELKKSANNKLFDRKGFDGGKRKPIYNGKYIDRAKQNIVENNYEDEEMDSDEPDEYVDPYTRNRIMYSNMVKRDKLNKRKRNLYREYPDIGHAKDLAKESDRDNNDSDLRKELADIKTMLSSAKKDLAKYKCPLQGNPQDIHKENTSANLSHKPKPHVKKPVVAPKKPLAAPKQAVEESISDDVLNDGFEDVTSMSDDYENKPQPQDSKPESPKAVHDGTTTHPTQNTHAVEVPTHVQVAAPQVVQQAAPTPAPTPVPPTTHIHVPAQAIDHNMINLAPNSGQ